MDPEKKTLLYVDDEKINLELFRLHFQYDFNIITYLSPITALNEAPFDKIDLILTDFKMPLLNGMEFIYEILKKFPHKKFIMISGFTDSDIITDEDRKYLEGFVSKPWKREIISEIIHKSLR